jgi:hypothetical protein
MRGLRRFKVRGKLTPRFIGPFKITEKRGEVAYRVAAAVVRCTRCVPCLSTEEMFAHA